MQLYRNVLPWCMQNAYCILTAIGTLLHYNVLCECVDLLLMRIKVVKAESYFTWCVMQFNHTLKNFVAFFMFFLDIIHTSKHHGFTHRYYKIYLDFSSEKMKIMYNLHVDKHFSFPIYLRSTQDKQSKRPLFTQPELF